MENKASNKGVTCEGGFCSMLLGSTKNQLKIDLEKPTLLPLCVLSHLNRVLSYYLHVLSLNSLKVNIFVILSLVKIPKGTP